MGFPFSAFLFIELCQVFNSQITIFLEIKDFEKGNFRKKYTFQIAQIFRGRYFRHGTQANDPHQSPMMRGSISI